MFYQFYHHHVDLGYSDFGAGFVVCRGHYRALIGQGKLHFQQFVHDVSVCVAKANATS